MADEDVTRVTQFDLSELTGSKQQQNAYLIVLVGANVGEMYKVDDAMSIGRSVSASIQILDEGISRKHCFLRKTAVGDLVIEDNHSTNGTFANGERISVHKLADGDKIQVGSTTILKFTYHDDLEESFQRQMYDSALRDGLTRTFNKRYFSDRLEAEFAYSDRHGSTLALAIMDLDHFKLVNDNYGHLAGDSVLQTLAQLVQQSVRTEDVFARYGGEEFAVISRGISAESGLVMAERIRQSVEQHAFVWERQRFPVTVSIGVAGLPDPGLKSADALIEAADSALYQAKHGGRNQVKIYRPSSS